MIELEALKAQLLLLGHDLPDDQIMGILKEMHIDFGADDSTHPPDDVAPHPEFSLSPGPPVRGVVEPAGLETATARLAGVRLSPPHGAWTAEQPHSSAGQPPRNQTSSYGYTGYQGLSSTQYAGTMRQPSLLDMQPRGAGTSSGAAAWPAPGRGLMGLDTGGDDDVLARGLADLEEHAAGGSRWRAGAAQPASGSGRDDYYYGSAASASRDGPAPPSSYSTKQPHEWYGKLASVSGSGAPSPALGLDDYAAPNSKSASRSLLHELSHSGGGGARPKISARTQSSQREGSFWANGAHSDEPDQHHDPRGAHVRTTVAGGYGASSDLDGPGRSHHVRRDFDDERTTDQDAWRGGATGAGSGAKYGDYPRHGTTYGDDVAPRGGSGISSGKAAELYNDRYLYDDLGDDVRPVPDAEDSVLPRGVLHPRPGTTHAAQQQQQRLDNEAAHYGREGSSAGGGAMSAADRAALRGAAAAAAAPAALRPVKYQWQDHLRSSGPVAASVASMPRSTAAPSVAGSRASSARPGAGPKKVDRVAAYQQMQKAWSGDRFLKHSAGKPANVRQAGAQVRKPDNFHAYFSIMHAMEVEAKERSLAAARTRSSASSAAAAGYVAPTSKRRDALRWETRQRLQG